MNLLDIVGPIMVGPSSSHTAGAVKIGQISKKLLDDRVVCAKLYMHGSFAATGKGHGTDRALIAGLLGMSVDDDRIPDSFNVAEEQGLIFSFENIELRDAHPNSVKLQLVGEDEKRLEVVAASIGGGRIRICEIDGLKANFEGDYPTLIVHSEDRPGHALGVTAMLAHRAINIASMQVYRAARGGYAVMVIECDNEVSEDSIVWLKKQEGIIKVTYLSQEK